MGEVKSLYGGPTGEKVRQQQCIEALREWLEMAESGEVVGVSVIATLHDGCHSHATAGNISYRGHIGTLEIVKAGLARDALE